MQTDSRFRTVELGLSALLLFFVAALFSIPPAWLPSASETSLVGVAITVGVWGGPAVLSVLSLYDASQTGLDVPSLVSSGLGGVTLGVLALNVRTVYLSDGLFSYGGRGMFLGPFIALGTGCLLATVVLLREFVDRTVRPEEDGHVES